MAPRWLEGLADVLDRCEAPCFVVSEALAEEVTGFHVHRGALASLERRPLPDRGVRAVRARGRCSCSRTSSTTPTSARSSAPGAALGFDAVLLAPRCADPLYRRSVKVAMGAVFALPWTRLPNWHDALSGLTRVGLHHGGVDLGRRRASRSNRRSPGWTGWPPCSARRGTGCLPAGRCPRTGGRSSRWPAASTRSTSRPPPPWPATWRPGARLPLR